MLMCACCAIAFRVQSAAPSGWSWAFNLSWPYWAIRALVLADSNDDVASEQLLGYAAGSGEPKWHAWENALYSCSRLPPPRPSR